MVDEFTEMIRIAAPDGGQKGNFVNKLVIFCEKFTHFRHEKNTIIRYYTYQIVKHIYYLPLILKTAAYGRRSFRMFSWGSVCELEGVSAVSCSFKSLPAPP